MPEATRILTFSDEAIDAAARLIGEGFPVAIATETVYGLAADATNAEAVARIYEAKGRPSFNPLIVHVPDLATAERIGTFNASARALAERLSNQWSVDCRISAKDDEAAIPIRLHLDLQQMLREAVANAVRHGNADRIDVGLAVEEGRLELSVADNGRGFSNGDGGTFAEPWSLKERVERANGTIRLVSAPGSTNVLISLPLAGAAA